MNDMHIINTNRAPYENRRPVVANTRTYNSIGDHMTPRKGFSRLHSNDRNIYEQLIEFAKSKAGTYTRGNAREFIDQALNHEMHASMRVKLENLIKNLGTNSNPRDLIINMLADYENLLSRIAPVVHPNESPAAYATRTNLPDTVVENVFLRGDMDTF